MAVRRGDGGASISNQESTGTGTPPANRGVAVAGRNTLGNLFFKFTRHSHKIWKTKIGHERGPEGTDPDDALCGPSHTPGASFGTIPGPGGAPRGVENRDFRSNLTHHPIPHPPTTHPPQGG